MDKMKWPEYQAHKKLSALVSAVPVLRFQEELDTFRVSVVAPAYVRTGASYPH